jgi:hypothetical protein
MCFFPYSSSNKNVIIYIDETSMKNQLHKKQMIIMQVSSALNLKLNTDEISDKI